MRYYFKIMAFGFIAIMALLLAIIFYFEFHFYLSIPVIRVSDFLPFYEEFMLSALPIPFIVLLFHRSQASYKEARFRKFLRIALGIMWILDAILQIQPEMNNLFAQYNLVPMLSMGYPVAPIIELSVKFWNINPPLVDLGAAVVQMYIGVLYLVLKRGKIFYIVQGIAIAWSAVIWVFGEGFGGLFTLGSSILTGLPGSVLLYLLGAVILVMTANEVERFNVERTMRYAAILLLLIALGFQSYPADGFWTSLPIIQFPSPFGFLGFAVATESRIAALSYLFNTVFILIIIAALLLWFFRSIFASIVTFVFAVFTWIVYQGIGIVAQFSTDSNTGLILAILMVAYIIYRIDSRSIHPEEIRGGMNRLATH